VPESQPELHEHFGITPHEAIKFGCIPIVYHLGGPAEHVNKIEFHRLFNSLGQLKNCLIETVELYPNSVFISNEISNYSKVIELENFSFTNKFFSINK
jgi:glycogen synthase